VTFRLHTASLHQSMRSTSYAKHYKALCSAMIGWFSTAVIGAFLVSCSLSGPLFRSYPVVVFLDREHPCFWNFNSSIPVDVVKSSVNRLFGPACLPMRITINKLTINKVMITINKVGCPSVFFSNLSILSSVRLFFFPLFCCVFF